MQLVNDYDTSDCILFQQAFNNKPVTACYPVQDWQIFSSFLIFCYYFNRLKGHEISYKIWETRKKFHILHLAPCAITKRFILKKYIQGSWVTSITIVWQYSNVLTLFQCFLSEERFHHFFIHLCFMLPSNFIVLGVKSLK